MCVRLSSRPLQALVALIAAATCTLAGAQPGNSQRETTEESLAIKIAPHPSPEAYFEIRGLSVSQTEALGTVKKDGRDWPQILAVFVGDEARSDATPMFGSYTVEKDRLRFTPRFPLQPGVTYRVVLRTDRFPFPADGSREPLVRTFTLPRTDPGPPAEVAHVFPSTDTLPENQLKFYLHFSAPMTQGDSYRHIHLVRAEGGEIDLPFLELGEELWDETGTRLTVFIDPGRIKRGLKPREDVGPVLEEGHRNTLVIDRDWTDAHGRPLKAAFRKSFDVGPLDQTQPSPGKWTIAAPTARSREPLKIEFSEPLDHAMLQRVLVVKGPSKGQVRGEVTVSQHETHWAFTPVDPWEPGSYTIEIDTTLEDLAGNSIGRPFEVDLFEKVERRVPTLRTTLRFVVKP